MAGFPGAHPASVFNPALALDEKSGKLLLLPRVVLGPYMYVSCIALLELDVGELAHASSGYVRQAKAVLLPDNKHDVWGAEDPKVSRVRGRLALAYSGRAVNYFDPMRWQNRTRPVVAVSSNGREWRKVAAFLPSPEVFGDVVSVKYAFLHEASGDLLYFFHRVHYKGGPFDLFVSSVPAAALEGQELKELYIENGAPLLEPEPWESQLGWGTPLVEVEKGKLVSLAFAFDADGVVSRAFAILFEERGGVLELSAITPFYVMEPREPFEKYGDRPMTVVPCGAAKVDNELIVSYGASEMFSALGSADVSTLMEALDKGSLEARVKIEPSALSKRAKP